MPLKRMVNEEESKPTNVEVVDTNFNKKEKWVILEKQF
jgi:hypothetical protein